MTFRLERRLRGYQPVHCLRDHLILYRGNALYRSDYSFENLRLLCRLPVSQELSALALTRLLRRIPRTGVQCSAVFDGDLFVVRRGTIFRVSPDAGSVVVDWVVPDGRRVLNLSLVHDPDGQREWLCFGEYFANPKRSAVRIWRRPRGDSAKWEIAAVFEAGLIDHIHNIVQTTGGHLFILTGDFDAAAALWRCTPTFSGLELALGGTQECRACWLWESSDGVFTYATDSQFHANHVLTVQELDGKLGEPRRLASIAGSSIYAAISADRCFFSSSVEPGESKGRFLSDLVDTKPGPGIMGEQAVIYAMDHERVREVFRARKDFWPMRLAQFGTFMFPSGEPPADHVAAYGVAVAGVDDTCLIFKATPA